jgi:hypothetical protein
VFAILLPTRDNAMTYRAPVDDILLALNHGAGFARTTEAGLLGDFDAEVTAAVLEEGARFAAEVLAPLNRDGDRVGVKFADGAGTNTRNRSQRPSFIYSTVMLFSFATTAASAAVSLLIRSTSAGVAETATEPNF